MTRRKIFGLASVLVLAAFISGGCGDGSSGNSAGDASGGSDDPINPDGELTIAYLAPPQSLDPHQQAGNADQPYTFMVFDRLTKVADDFTVEPMLAESWEFVDAALELKLRDDVEFNDGTPFNADAVKANIERAIQPDSSTSTALSAVTGVEVLDEYTVRLGLSGGGGDLPVVLATTAGAMVSPQALSDPARVESLATDPGDAGTGAYTTAEVVPGESVVFERIDDENWDADAGQARTIEVTFVPDVGARLNGTEAGDFDLAQISGDGSTEANELIESGVLEGATPWVLVGNEIMFNSTIEPYDDPRVRQAISYAIDREAIGNDLFDGLCRPQAQYYPEDHWAHNADAEELYTYDPDRAQDLLDEAGQSDLSFTLSYNEIYDVAAQAIAQQLEDIGIQVNLDLRSGNEADVAMRSGEIPALLGTMSNAPDPSLLISNWFLSGLNLAEYDRASYEGIQSEANDPALSLEERQDAYREAMLKPVEDAAYVHVCSRQQTWLHPDTTENVDQIGWLWAGLPDWRYVASSE